jgi:hypothetical protein
LVQPASLPTSPKPVRNGILGAILGAIETDTDPKLVRQAIDTARRRGLVRGEDLRALEARARGPTGT